MNTNEILSYVKGHPSGKVKIAYADIDGILRGKYLSREKFLSIAEKETSFCDVILGWDAADQLYDRATLTGWHSGFPDTPARIDLSTFRKIPWENDLPFFLGELNTADAQPSPGCSRQLLKKVIADSHGMGYYPQLAQEFEWYFFNETPESAHQKKFAGLKPLTPGMFGYSILRTTLQNELFTSLFDQLNAFSIPIEGLHTETGPGTYEAAISHADALEAGDRAVLFKTAVKEIAYKQGVMATFMAKIDENLPGCGGHVHQSLCNDKGNNLFYDGKSSDGLSEVARQYIAGQLHCLPYLLPLFAPTINSYKRLVEGAWAPTTLTWGIDNRTVALRVLNGSERSCRLETRVVGSDVNPYLALAGCLASGLYGIRHQLALDRSPTTGNGYADKKAGTLPQTLIEAIHQFRTSPIPAELFGTAFVEHYAQSREWEWRQHLKAVTDWEYKRYFEII